MPTIKPIGSDDDDGETMCVGDGSASLTAFAASERDMAAFREHALKLRDAGAIEVRTAEMVVIFDRSWNRSAAAVDAAIAALPSPPDAEPTDEDYVP